MSTLKARILAMKAENPRLWPKDIAKALNCRRQYVCHVVCENRGAEPEKHRREDAIRDVAQIGSGRRQRAEYLRLM